MSPNFERLVHFEDPSGKIHYGEAGRDWQKDLVGQTVPTYRISDVFDDQYILSGDEAEISKVAAPSQNMQGLKSDSSPGSVPIGLGAYHDRHRAELQGACGGGQGMEMDLRDTSSQI